MNASVVVSHTAEPDRVRANTHPSVNARIDRKSQARIHESAAGSNLTYRIEELGREWDFERIIEAEAAITGLVGLALAVGMNKRFLLIPGIAASMMLLHAVHGWYPLLPLLRRMAIRTRDEIERERYALKALRGDFTPVRTAESERRADAAWQAVQL